MTDLVERLRKRAAWQRENWGDMLDHGTPNPELEQAADRIETLEAEITRLEHEREIDASRIGALYTELKRLRGKRELKIITGEQIALNPNNGGDE